MQGVFFREWTLARARELDVSGWVRNRSNGSVEIYAAAEPEALACFIERLREGSPASRVDKVRHEDAKVEQVDGFTRRQTT